MSTSDEVVIGFSLNGDVIAAGSGTLVELEGAVPGRRLGI